MDWSQEFRILQETTEAQLLSSLINDRIIGIQLSVHTQTKQFSK